MFKFLLPVFLTVGCGSINANDIVNNVVPKIGPTVVDPSIISEYNNFLERCSRSKYAALCNKNIENLRYVRIVDFIAVPANTKPGTIGKCDINYVSRSIELKRKWLNRGGFDAKSLLWHEFSHCLANMNHKEGRHIMSPTSINIQSYEEWNELVDEMFE